MYTQHAKSGFDASAYQITSGEHRHKKIIWCSFPYNPQLIRQLKQQVPSASWSASIKLF